MASHAEHIEWYDGGDDLKGWVVRCSCHWSSGPHDTRDEAHQMGDWHREHSKLPPM